MATKKKTTPKTPEELEKYLCDKADKSSRHFIAQLALAILNLPRIKEPTQEAADKKSNRILDNLLKAFTTAQCDAQKAGFTYCMNQFMKPTSK